MIKTLESDRDWRAYWEDRGTRADTLTQVGRTVRGSPITPDQVDLLLEAILKLLSPNKREVILDLCCGNGFVTQKLSYSCLWVYGVDYSLKLIQAARRYQTSPNVTYLHKEAAEIVRADFIEGCPSKICINGGLQYFSSSTLKGLLRVIARLGEGASTLLFTDVPDADKIWEFYDTPDRRAEFKVRRAERTEAIGTWWDRQDLEQLLSDFGYITTFVEQDPQRDTAHYRFDLKALKDGGNLA